MVIVDNQSETKLFEVYGLKYSLMLMRRGVEKINVKPSDDIRLSL